MALQTRTSSRNHRDRLRLALPSDGDLYEPSLSFLASCGLNVERRSTRSYTAYIPSLEGADVLFQRTADITQKVEEGSAEMGIVGLDRFLEYRHETAPVVAVIEGLGFGRCDLVLAVPDWWLDVSSVSDLADLAVEFRHGGRQLRIATKYPRLVRQFLFAREIYYFTLVQASGSLEVAPAAGYADLIADLTASGTTLRENRLKVVEDGTVLQSEACLIGHRDRLLHSQDTLSVARMVLETIEAHLKARSYYRLTANVHTVSPEEVSESILSRRELAGLQGPTISRVYNVDDTDWYSVSLMVPKESLLEAVDHLRKAGAQDIATSRINYLFESHCSAYQRLLGDSSLG